MNSGRNTSAMDYLRLGKVLSDDDLKALQNRINEIMMGTALVDTNRLLMQLDSKDGAYENAPEQSRGHKGATLDYRKIQDLEHDDLFLEYMQRPHCFAKFARTFTMPDTSIAAFRAMFMNKPAHKGTLLPWHQDRWNYLDRDPMITVWTALDPGHARQWLRRNHSRQSQTRLVESRTRLRFLSAPRASKNTRRTSKSNTSNSKRAKRFCCITGCLHRSDKNGTDISRRAYSVCYMDAEHRFGARRRTIYASFLTSFAKRTQSLRRGRGEN